MLRRRSPLHGRTGRDRQDRGQCRAGLVDELQLFAVPVAVGGGKRWFPKDVRLDVQLANTRRFANGVLYSNYHLKGQG